MNTEPAEKTRPMKNEAYERYREWMFGWRGGAFGREFIHGRSEDYDEGYMAGCRARGKASSIARNIFELPTTDADSQ